MGRIKTQQIKRITKMVMQEHPDKLKEDFDENKKVISSVLDVKSKKLRNIIAGYTTRLNKAKQ